MTEALSIPPGKSGVCAEPDSSFLILQYAPNRVTTQPLPSGVLSKTGFVVTVHAFSGRAEPEVSCFILQSTSQRIELGAALGSDQFLIEYRHGNTERLRHSFPIPAEESEREHGE